MRAKQLYGEALTPAPTSDVPFTGGRILGVAAVMGLDSPALSAKVLRLGSGSFAVPISLGNQEAFFIATYAVALFYVSSPAGAFSRRASGAHCFVIRRSQRDLSLAREFGWEGVYGIRAYPIVVNVSQLVS